VQSCQELRYGRVSAGELVQAVQELLSAAGIHMDVEKQSLLQNTISLQDQLKESQAALLLEQVSVACLICTFLSFALVYDAGVVELCFEQQDSLYILHRGLGEYPLSTK